MKEAGLHNLNVSTIFTYNPNEDMNKNKEVHQQNDNPKHSREELETVIKDYNKMFDKNFLQIHLMDSLMMFLSE